MKVWDRAWTSGVPVSTITSKRLGQQVLKLTVKCLGCTNSQKFQGGNVPPVGVTNTERGVTESWNGSG